MYCTFFRCSEHRQIIKWNASVMLKKVNAKINFFTAKTFPKYLINYFLYANVIKKYIFILCVNLMNAWLHYTIHTIYQNNTVEYSIRNVYNTYTFYKKLKKIKTNIFRFQYLLKNNHDVWYSFAITKKVTHGGNGILNI